MEELLSRVWWSLHEFYKISTRSIRDDLYWTSRKSSLELIELSIIFKLFRCQRHSLQVKQNEMKKIVSVLSFERLYKSNHIDSLRFFRTTRWKKKSRFYAYKWRSRYKEYCRDQSGWHCVGDKPRRFSTSFVEAGNGKYETERSEVNCWCPTEDCVLNCWSLFAMLC
jgi:hypothetical protein